MQSWRHDHVSDEARKCARAAADREERHDSVVDPHGPRIDGLEHLGSAT